MKIFSILLLSSSLFIISFAMDDHTTMVLLDTSSHSTSSSTYDSDTSDFEVSDEEYTRLQQENRKLRAQIDAQIEDLGPDGREFLLSMLQEKQAPQSQGPQDQSESSDDETSEQLQEKIGKMQAEIARLRVNEAEFHNAVDNLPTTTRNEMLQIIEQVGPTHPAYEEMQYLKNALLGLRPA